MSPNKDWFETLNLVDKEIAFVGNNMKCKVHDRGSIRF